MLVNIIKSYRDIVTICDSELIGKKFVSQASDDLGKSSERGKFQLDIKENFFGGDKTSEEETIKIMRNMAKEDAIFNIVGEKSVNTALKAGIVLKAGIKRIQGVPFAMILM